MHDPDKSISFDFIRFGLLFSAIGILLNLVWEYFQCLPFFRHIKNQPTFVGMIGASFGDVAMMWVAFLMVVIFTRSFFVYQENWNFKQTSFLFLSSILIAIIVEILALNENRWQYTARNPILPYLGVSALPVLQMALINPISMHGSKLILNRLAKAKQNEKEYV